MISKLAMFDKMLLIESEGMKAKLKLSDDVYKVFVESIDKQISVYKQEKECSELKKTRMRKVFERFTQDLKDSFGFTDDFTFNFPKDFTMDKNRINEFLSIYGAFYNSLQLAQYGFNNDSQRDDLAGYLEKGQKYFD